MVLTRTTGTKWRDEPGPLKLRRINTGAGSLRIDPSFGGIVVAEVQADLGAHGVTVESTPDEKFYQSQGRCVRSYHIHAMPHHNTHLHSIKTLNNTKPRTRAHPPLSYIYNDIIVH